ncbi:unnamed protein product [Ilex paraguariensis]|uniref:Uncharacterized protein n=1 Tax=Ilex paraguariensis TaxID=185542 RepID=A0ABC8R2T6_9AQUA
MVEKNRSTHNLVSSVKRGAIFSRLRNQDGQSWKRRNRDGRPWSLEWRKLRENNRDLGKERRDVCRQIDRFSKSNSNQNSKYPNLGFKARELNGWRLLKPTIDQNLKSEEPVFNVVKSNGQHS